MEKSKFNLLKLSDEKDLTPDERRKYYEDRPEEVERILKEGTAATKRKAEEVMRKVRKNMKLDYFE